MVLTPTGLTTIVIDGGFDDWAEAAYRPKPVGSL